MLVTAHAAPFRDRRSHPPPTEHALTLTSTAQFIAPLVKDAISSFEDHVNPEDLPRLHDQKTLVVMEGPQFSTRAESNMYRLWGGDIINMSAIPESKLAREAELR